MTARLVVYALALAAALAWTWWRTREPAPIEIVVVREGLVAVGGETLELSQLGPQIAARLERSPRPRVLVAVDGNAPSVMLIPVLNALDANGVHDVEVVTIP
ncbi:MAG: biopolymer transporter ExbD [Pseudomonadota bacterium]